MTVSPNAKLDHGVNACIYERAPSVTDAEIKEVNRLDYGYRERDKKQEKSSNESEKDCKERR